MGQQMTHIGDCANTTKKLWAVQDIRMDAAEDGRYTHWSPDLLIIKTHCRVNGALNTPMENRENGQPHTWVWLGESNDYVTFLN